MPQVTIFVIDNRRLFLVLALLNALWAPVNLMVLIARADGMTPAAIATCRWLSLGLLIALALRIPAFRTKTRAVWPKPWDAVQAATFGLFLWAPSHLMFYTALGRTSSVEGTVLNTTAPIWTAGLAFLVLREKATATRILALLVGLAGAWIVSVGFRMPSLQSSHAQGNLLYLSGTILECTSGVLSIRLLRRSSGICILLWEITGASIGYVLAPHMVPSLLPLTFHLTWGIAAAVGYLVLFAGLCSFGGWYMLVERAPVSLMIVSILLQPPLAALLSWIFLHEPVSSDLLIGTVLVFVALLIAVREPASTPTPL